MIVPTKDHCPLCGYYADAYTGVSSDPNAKHHAPRSNDVALCINCGGLTIYTVFGRRRPTDQELDEILKDETIVKVITAINEAKR